MPGAVGSGVVGVGVVTMPKYCSGSTGLRGSGTHITG
jgi:hypothetical protein